MKFRSLIVILISTGTATAQLDSIAVDGGNLPSTIFCNKGAVSNSLEPSWSGFYVNPYYVSMESRFDTLYNLSDSSLYSGQVFFFNNPVRYDQSDKVGYFYETTCTFLEGVKSKCTRIDYVYSYVYGDKDSGWKCDVSEFIYDSISMRYRNSYYERYRYGELTYHVNYCYQNEIESCLSTSYFNGDTSSHGLYLKDNPHGVWKESVTITDLEGNQWLEFIECRYENGVLIDILTENVLYIDSDYNVISKEMFFQEYPNLQRGQFDFKLSDFLPEIYNSGLKIILTVSNAEYSFEISRQKVKKIGRSFRKYNKID